MDAEILARTCEQVLPLGTASFYIRHKRGDDAEKRDKPLILDGAKLVPATKKHKFEQWWYGVTEPYLLKYGNLMLSNPILREIYIHQKAPASLPVSIVLSTNAACNFIDFIYSANGANGSARMSITKCVCQTTLKNVLRAGAKGHVPSVHGRHVHNDET